MIKIYPELKNWSFDINEVSAGVFEIIGLNKLGGSISLKGIDPEDLLARCKKEAATMDVGMQKKTEHP